MNTKLQLEIAKEYWENSGGNPDVKYCGESDLEKRHALEELIKKGVLKRNNGCYSVCSATKTFIDNNGKTESELEKEKEEYRKDESLRIAKRSNCISWWAIIISILAIVVSILKK